MHRGTVGKWLTLQPSPAASESPQNNGDIVRAGLGSRLWGCVCARVCVRVCTHVNVKGRSWCAYALNICMFLPQFPWWQIKKRESIRNCLRCLYISFRGCHALSKNWTRSLITWPRDEPNDVTTSQTWARLQLSPLLHHCWWYKHESI